MISDLSIPPLIRGNTWSVTDKDVTEMTMAAVAPVGVHCNKVMSDPLHFNSFNPESPTSSP